MMNNDFLEVEKVIKSYKKDFFAYMVYADMLEEEGRYRESLAYRYIGKKKKWPAHKMSITRHGYEFHEWYIIKKNKGSKEHEFPAFIMCELSYTSIPKLIWGDVKWAMNDIMGAIFKAIDKGWIK